MRWSIVDCQTTKKWQIVFKSTNAKYQIVSFFFFPINK